MRIRIVVDNFSFTIFALLQVNVTMQEKQGLPPYEKDQVFVQYPFQPRCGEMLNSIESPLGPSLLKRIHKI